MTPLLAPEQVIDGRTDVPIVGRRYRQFYVTSDTEDAPYFEGVVLITGLWAPATTTRGAVIYERIEPTPHSNCTAGVAGEWRGRRWYRIWRSL